MIKIPSREATTTNQFDIIPRPVGTADDSLEVAQWLPDGAAYSRYSLTERKVPNGLPVVFEFRDEYVSSNRRDCPRELGPEERARQCLVATLNLRPQSKLSVRKVTCMQDGWIHGPLGVGCG